MSDLRRTHSLCRADCTISPNGSAARALRTADSHFDDELAKAVSASSHFPCTWTAGESEFLKKELSKFEGKNGISYLQVCVSIAAMLPNKLVRDVAQRVQLLRIFDYVRLSNECKDSPNIIQKLAEDCRYVIGHDEGEFKTPVQLSRDMRELLAANSGLFALLEIAGCTNLKEHQLILNKIFRNLLEMEAVFKVQYPAFNHMPCLPVRLSVQPQVVICKEI